MGIFLGILLLSVSGIHSSVYAAPNNEPEHVKDRLLIKFKDGVSSSQKKSILENNGVVEIDEISQIQVKVLKVPEKALNAVQTALQKNKSVEYVEKDFILKPASIPNDPKFSLQWQLQKLRVPEAWDISGNNPVTIAILDTGVAPDHPDLAGKIVSGYNFYDNNADWSAVCSHGTAVAGSATAMTNNALGIAGLAPEAKIMPIRISSGPPSCSGTYSAITKGVLFAADNGARVANISFAIYDGSVITDAAKYMYNKGGWVVASAGNDGNFWDKKDNPYIISVSAVKKLDDWAGYTYGPFVDFTAPGVLVYTTFPAENGYYGYASGTSFASPIVAGTIALLMATNPDLTPSQIYDILKNSSVDLGTPGYDYYFGWGRVDAYGALLQTTPTPSPADITPPSAPSLVAPASGAVTNDNTPTFDWTDVSDPSLPVTYEILVDNNNAFSSPEISKQSLSSSDYTQATSLADGTYYWKVRATDGVGNIGSYSAVRTVIIDTTPIDITPPTITITNPADGTTASGLITVSADASDNVEVSSVELFVNNVYYAKKTSGPYDFTVDGKDLPSGSNTLMAKAFDTSNNSNDDTITVLVAELERQSSIIITSPENGAQVNGKITITTQVSNIPNISSVKFFIDGSLIGKVSSEPYQYGWHTKGESTGDHTITVEASDTNSNTVSSSITVQIPSKQGKSKNVGPQEIDFEQQADMLREDETDSSEIIKTSIEEQSEIKDSILTSETPIFIPIVPQVVAEGSLLLIDISTSNSEGNNFSFPQEDQDIPAFSKLMDNSDGTATLKIIPEFEDAGDYTIVILAKDDGVPPLSSSITILLTVTEGTPESVIQYLQNLKSNLGSEDIKNLGEKVSNAAQLHKYLTEATKQERSDFQDLFHEYIKDTKNLLGIAQTAEEKIILQDIKKTEIRVDHAFEKLDIKEDHENKVKDTMMLIEKRKELADTINQIISLEHFIKEKSEKEKQIEELTAKKLVLMKEVMIEEAKQSNVELSDDDVKKIVEIDQSSQSQSSQTKSTGQDNVGTKTNNGQDTSGTKSNNGQGSGGSNKSNGNDKSNNGKSANDKSNK